MVNLLKASSTLLASLSLGFLLFACGEQPKDAVAEAPEISVTTAPQDAAAPATPQTESASVETGMFFKPDLEDYSLHNEYDDDGNGDGVKETHVRRYINSKGDSAFSLTTNDKLWAWSVDTKAGDDADTSKNYVIRNSNCDNVFDERYNLNAEFHVPDCLLEAGAADK